MRAAIFLSLALLSGCAAFGPGDAPDEVAANAREGDVMTGMYRYMADAGLFTDCEFSKTYPVATAADNADLERAYLAGQSGPGEPMLVSFRGRIQALPAMEGDQLVPTVIVNRFIRVWPEYDCFALIPPIGLLDVTWNLNTLYGDSASTAEAVPTLRLDAEKPRASGTGGCNSYSCSYWLVGESIEFGSILATKKGCARDILDLEDGFFTMLREATGWRIEFGVLYLFAGDDVIATLSTSKE